MLKVLTSDEMRVVDEETTRLYKIPSILLMENAARCVVDILEKKLDSELYRKRFLVVCGKGNNGGDGAAVARILWMKGAVVKVVLIGRVEETKGDARINFDILRELNGLKSLGGKTAIEFYELEEIDSLDLFLKNTDIVIDAIFGAGLSRPVEGKFERAVSVLSNWKENTNGFLVSVDLPSGLNSNSYKPIGPHLKADLTVTFTAPKIANVFPPATKYCGELFVVNIGTPKELLDSCSSKIFLAEREDIAIWLKRTKVRSDSYKKKRGRVLILAGSSDYVGAAVLAANACFSSGAGIVTLAVPEEIRHVVASKTMNEVIVRSIKDERIFQENFECIAIGCGLALGDQIKNIIERLAEKTVILLDAEALNALAPFDFKTNFPLVLTPHLGEFERLFGRKVSDRVKDPIEFATKSKAILFLKGERNLVVKPDGTAVVIPTGDPGVSRAGAGDTLTGILSAFIAQGLVDCQPSIENVFESVVSGAYIAGLAAEISSKDFSRRLMTPTSVISSLKEALEVFDET